MPSQVPPQVPEAPASHLPSQVPSHLPLELAPSHLPSHLPAQVPLKFTSHLPWQAALQVPLHSPPASTEQEPLHSASHLPEISPPLQLASSLPPLMGEPQASRQAVIASIGTKHFGGSISTVIWAEAFALSRSFTLAATALQAFSTALSASSPSAFMSASGMLRPLPSSRQEFVSSASMSMATFLKFEAAVRKPFTLVSTEAPPLTVILVKSPSFISSQPCAASARSPIMTACRCRSRPTAP